MDTSPRQRVPDLELVADQLLNDLNVPDDETGGEAQAKLDAIGTLTGLDEDDLIGLAILLALRLIAADGPSGDDGES